MTRLVNDGAEALLAERRRMRPWRRAWRQALRLVPAPAPHGHVLAAWDAMAADPAVPEDLRAAMLDVAQPIRLHPDVEAWAPAFLGLVAPGLPAEAGETVVDEVFRLAMAIEAGDAARRDAVLARIAAALDMDEGGA